MKKPKSFCYADEMPALQTLDVYLPDCASFPVFVYFHGGGLVDGDKAGDEFYRALTEKGIAVVTANYRLYPAAVYPAFIRDAAAAVAWAIRHMPEYGTVTGVYAGGSSAGGYLAQMLCFDKKYLGIHGIDADSLSGYVLDAGQPTAHFNVLAERGLDSRRIIVDEAAPLYHICAARNYPPLKIIVSDHDIPNRYEQTLLLVSTLKHFGHENCVDFQVMPDSEHCSYVNARTPDGGIVFADIIGAFLTKGGGAL